MTAAGRIVRWIAVGGSVVLGLIVATGAYVYVASERVIHRQYDVPLRVIDILTDSQAVAEGERLAHIRGCFGCHGVQLQGEVWEDDFLGGRLVAPNVPELARRYSPAELARVIRTGVRANGEGVISMPSPMFYHLSDSDVSHLVAFLRASPVAEGPRYDREYGSGVRWDMAMGNVLLQPDIVAGMGPRMAVPAPGDTLALGGYLAQTSCTECHGAKLEGDWGPNLVVAAGYLPEEFALFMEFGVASGGRELPVMSRVARGRFSYLTDAEVAALHAFLRARAEGAIPG